MEPLNPKVKRFLVAVLVGGVAGALAGAMLKGFGLAPFRTPTDALAPAAATPADCSPAGAQRAPADYDSAALDYAHAMQQGNWDRVIEMTLWMRDRLDYVGGQTGDGAAVMSARQELAGMLAGRDAPGNRLTAQGIEDSYVFAPGAQVEAVAVDSGREDLAAPVAERVWLKVTFPSRARAPRDSMGLPIKALTVGVNVSAEGYILKAGIIGNLEIAWEAVSYAWEPPPGG